MGSADAASAYALQQTDVSKADSTQATKSAGAAPTMFFFIWTTVYVFILYSTWNAGEDTNIDLYTTLYLLVTLVSQYFFNVGETKAHCGEAQWTNSIMITIVPWIAVFGSLNLMLTVFPGWLSPFANTMGYGIAKLMGLDSKMKEMLAKPPDAGSTGQNADLAQAIAHVRGDPSLIFNQIPSNPKQAKNFYENTSSLWDGSQPSTGKEQLNKLVYAKQLTSWYVWYLLAGTLCIRMSISFMANSTCVRSVESRTKSHDDYMAELKKKPPTGPIHQDA